MQFQTVQLTLCTTSLYIHCSLTSYLLMCPFDLGEDSRNSTTLESSPCKYEKYQYKIFNRSPSNGNIYSKQVNNIQSWPNETSVLREKSESKPPKGRLGQHSMAGLCRFSSRFRVLWFNGRQTHPLSSINLV